MKKNNNVTSVEAFFATQRLEQQLKEEIAKEQKRLWLRTKIHEITGISETSDSESIAFFDVVFDWIYQSPIYEWEGMLYCLQHEYMKIVGTWSDYNKALDNAKSLYSFLK